MITFWGNHLTFKLTRLPEQGELWDSLEPPRLETHQQTLVQTSWKHEIDKSFFDNVNIQTWWGEGARWECRWWEYYPSKVCLVSQKAPTQFRLQRNRKGFCQQNILSTRPCCLYIQSFLDWIVKDLDSALASSSTCCMSDDQMDTTASHRRTSRNRGTF